MFTPDFKSEPYWWDRSPRPNIPKTELPASVDVAVVGSGNTGLNAALVTARGGRSTCVFDAGDAGFGCSSRNGGQISTSVKPSLAQLTRKYGAEVAVELIKDGQCALGWIGDFVARENIDCDFGAPGRCHAAHNPRAFDKMVAGARHQPKGLEVPYQVVTRSDQHSEIGTDSYHGGIVYEQHACLDPARYHKSRCPLWTKSCANICN